MEHHQEIYRRVVAWIQGEITPEEKAELERWLQQDPKNREWFDAFTKKENIREALSLYASFHTDERWKVLELTLQSGRVKRFIYWRYVAAAVVAVFLLGAIGLRYWGKEEVPRLAIGLTDTRDLRQQAVLIMEDGREMVLSGIKDTCLVLNRGERLWIDTTGELAYRSDSLKSEVREEWHVLRIPRGGEYRLVLEDGSKVWLNSASEFRYPVHFTGDKRQVELEGEAYFEVARNEACPFIVKAGDQQVRVLGTAFDVTAYREETAVYTTLLEGRVEVVAGANRRLLQPGEQAIYNSQGLEVRKVNARLYCSWIHDRFVFMSEELESVARKLERWYDVQFFFAGESLKEKRFTGSIPKYSELTKVLEMLELTTTIRFKKQGRTVVVETMP